MSEQEIRKILASKLKECRQRAGLTAKEAGAAIGKSEKTVSAWEHGRGQPDADMLFTLCKLYHIESISVFYGEKEKPLSLTAYGRHNENIGVDEKELLTLYCSIDELDLIQKFRTLDTWGKQAVDAVVEVESARCSAAPQASSADELVPTAE